MIEVILYMVTAGLVISFVINAWKDATWWLAERSGTVSDSTLLSLFGALAFYVIAAGAGQ